MSRKLMVWVLAAAVGVGLTLLIGNGFRVEYEDNPALGLFEYRYRWWKPRQIAVDSNRDGAIDARAVLEEGAVDFHDALQEYWEDRDSDGYFEIHAIFSRGVLEVAEVDNDRDGLYEERVTGIDAADFFKKLGAQER